MVEYIFVPIGFQIQVKCRLRLLYIFTSERGYYKQALAHIYLVFVADRFCREKMFISSSLFLSFFIIQINKLDSLLRIGQIAFFNKKKRSASEKVYTKKENFRLSPIRLISICMRGGGHIIKMGLKLD